MKKTILIVFICIFSFSLLPDSLNLVEIQKKEEKRRKKAGKSKFVLNNDKIVKFALKKSKSFVESDVPATSTIEKTPKKKASPDEKDSEEYWRGRLKNLNNSIAGLKSRIDSTQSSLNRESSNFLIAATPSLQQQIKNNVDALTKQLEKLKSDLKQREIDRENFFVEARKFGVLPGWLR